LDHVLRTSPFAGSSVAIGDLEGSAYVPRDNSLWLADDDGRAIYEVDVRSGVLKRRITRDRFADVRRLDGGVRAGRARTHEINALAYDANSDSLFAFTGLTTAFRLTRTTGRLQLDSYQPLSGVLVEAAAWNPGDGRLYIGGFSTLWPYSYVKNTVGSPLHVPGVRNIYGMDFTDDGKNLFASLWGSARVTRVSWPSRIVVPGWDLDLAAFGLLDARGVEVINDQLWVSDGSDLQPPGDPKDHAVLVFDVGGSGITPPATAPGASAVRNLIGNAGFERSCRGWDTLAGTDVALTRVRGGHNGSWAAHVKRTKGTGAIRLADVPGWVDRTRGGTYTGSLWVRSSKPGGNLRLRLQERDGERTVGQTVARVELTRRWQQVSVSLVPRSPRRSSIDYSAMVSRARAGTSFDADGASLTRSRL
jgi:hypothetical protein